MNILDSAGLGYFWGKIKSFFVTALGTNGNYLTWTKNGTTNNITVPFATTSSKVGSSTVGSSTKPVYINSGTPTAVSGVSELYISKGWPEGYISADLTPTLLPLILTTAGNRLALLPPSQVIIEKTTDGGTTWVDAGVSDATKRTLFSGTDANGSVTIPLLDGVKSKQCGIRITITGMKYNVPEGTAETNKYQYWNDGHVTGVERYVSLSGMYFWVNTNTDNLKTRIRCATGKNPNNWVDADNGNYSYLSGWSGGSYVFLKDYVFGGQTSQNTNYWNYRIECFTDGVKGGNLSASYTTSAQSIQRILGYGRDGLVIPNRLVGINHLYTWDSEQTMITKSVRPDTNNTHNLGSTSWKWANVHATTFHGSLDGNASTATKATQDASGNVITSTYATKTEVASLQDIVGGKVTKIVLGTVDYTPSSGVVTLPAYPTTLPASDVSDWAKAANKPSYSFSEITGTAAASQIPTLAISKISNLQSTLDAKVTKVKLGTTEYSPSSGVISLPAYPTTLPASDVYAWAKAATKPTYSFSEITGSISATQMHAGINNLTEGTSDPVDNDYYIAQYAGGGTTTKTYHRKKHSSLFNYIKGKLPSWSTASTKPAYNLDEVADGSTRKLANYLPLSGGTMSSTSVVTSLNADMLDGKHLSDLLYENTGGWCAGSGSYWGKILEGVMDVTGTVDTTITLLVSDYTTTSNGYFGLLVIDVRGDNKSKISNIKANWVLLTNSTMVSYTKVTHDYVDGKRYVRVYVFGSGWGHSINVKILNEHKWAGKSTFVWNTYKAIYNGNQVPTYASIPTTDTEAEVTIAIKSILNNASTATQLANERTLTIGNTGKKFDGSANVSWSLNEIGAAAASHNHNIESLTNYSSRVYDPTASRTKNTILAAPNGSDGAAVFRDMHWNDLPTGQDSGYSDMFLYRQAGNGEADLSSGIAKINAIKGNTLVWNQILKSYTQNDINTIVNDCTVRLYGTPSGNLSVTVALYIKLKANHKYYVRTSAISASNLAAGLNGLEFRDYSQSVNFLAPSAAGEGIRTIYTNTVDRNDCGLYTVLAGGTSINQYVTFKAFDLTQMFGSGKEPTIDEFEALFSLDNYTTTGGRLINFNGETLRGIKTNARNWGQLISNWNFRNRTSGWSTSPSVVDMTINNDGSCRIKNKTASNANFDIRYYTSIFNGHKFYFAVEVKSSSNTAIAPIVQGYQYSTYAVTADTKTKISFIGTVYYKGNISRAVYIPSNGDRSVDAYIDIYSAVLFDLTAMFGAGNEPSTATDFETILESLGNPTNEEDFNAANTLGELVLNPAEWTGKLNGEGESVNVFQDGMKSAGNVCDEVVKIGGLWRAKVNVWDIDLGTLSWFYTGTYFSSSNLPKAGTNSYNNVCSKYQTKSLKALQKTNDKALGISYIIYGRDTAYSDAATFKASVQGVMLNYELETPLEYILDDEWQNVLNSALGVGANGLEIVSPENTSEPYTSPAIIDMRYGIDVVDDMASLMIVNTQRASDKRLDEVISKTDYLSRKTIEYIKGTQTAATGNWTGKTEDVELYDGKHIYYYLTQAPSGNASLQLTLANGEQTENLPVFYNDNTRITTHFPVNSVISMTYDATNARWRCDSNYDSNTTVAYGLNSYYFRPYAGQAIYRYKFLMQGEDNRMYPIVTTNQENATIIAKTPISVGLRPHNVWYYNSTTTINAGAVIGGQTLLESSYGSSAPYNFNELTPAYRMIYLRGTYDKVKDLFYLYNDGATTCKSYYTFVPNNAANIVLSNYFVEGYYYLLLGGTYSTDNAMTWFANKPFYYFDGTNLIPVQTKITNDFASNMVTTNTDQTISGNKTFSSDLTIFSKAHRDTYYASNVCRLFYQTTYDEFVIYTKIKYNATHMPVVRMYGYAYGLQSPIELKVGFYIYQKVIGYCGVISHGAWKPAVYLWKYTHTDNVEYIAIGLKGECYFCGFQVDVQIGASGSFNTIATSGWTVNGLKATADNFLIPQEATDDNRLVQVPYKTIKTDITGNITGNSGSATKLATARTLTIGSKGKGFDGTANVSWSLAEIGALPISGGTMTGVLKMQADQYADSYSGALNMSNSNIFGVNSIYTADASENSPEGIHFYRSATAVDTIYAKSGVFYFVPNRTLGTNGTSYKIWHEGNISELRAALSIPNGTITSVTYNGTTVDSGAVDLGDVLTSDDDVAYVDNVGEVVVPSTLIKLVTQAQYDAITNKDSETIYIVVDNESDAGADATISHFAIVSLTTAEYEALEEKDDQTLYLIS